jgi:hypothetical protein
MKLLSPSLTLPPLARDSAGRRSPAPPLRDAVAPPPEAREPAPDRAPVEPAEARLDLDARPPDLDPPSEAPEAPDDDDFDAAMACVLLSV